MSRHGVVEGVAAPAIEVGTAVRTGPTSFDAGAHAAAEALAPVGRYHPSAVLVFASVAHDLGAALRGVRSVVGETPVLGASTAGEICAGTHQGSVVVAVLASPHLSVRVGVGERVSAGWRAALDQALGAPDLAPLFDGSSSAWAALERAGRSAFALLFSPGNTRSAPSPSFELLEALKRRALGRLQVFGGSAADDWRMERNFVLCGDRAVPDAVLVAVLETELRFGIAFAHGLAPSGGVATVTEAEGHEVVALDGVPAAEGYARLLGTTRAALEGRHLALGTGRVLGSSDPAGAVIPNVASYFTPRGGVLVTRPVSPGTELRVLHPTGATTATAGPEAVRKARLRGTIARPALALTSYCALRPKLLGEEWRSELPRMAEALEGAPLVGFQSFGEQAPSDDGVAQHTNAVIAALVIGDELAPAAQAVRAARETEDLRREAEALRRRAREELERLVAERTAELRAANESLAREVEQRRRAEAAAQRHERAVRTLRACNEAVFRASDEAKLLEDVCRIVVEVGGYRLAWVGYAERDERRSVRPAAVWGQDDGYVAQADVVWSDTERGRGPVGTAIRTGRPALARRISSDPSFAVWRAQAEKRGLAAMLALPLVCEGETLGALAIYSADLDALADERELKLLAELAVDLAFGIGVVRGRAERARMRAKLVEADRLAAVGTLAAGVAHEINNPLTTLLGGLDFVAGEIEAAPPLDEARRALREMRAGGERIRDIVRDLGTFSRGGDGGEGAAPLDLRAVAESAIQVVDHEIRHRARLVRDLRPVPAVRASAARLGQVLVNLLVNAAHAVPAGAAHAHEIRVSTRTGAGGEAICEVADTGCGIAAEHLPRIFEPFFTTKPPGAGTGLGLWVCRNLVAAVGGDLRAESAPGEGTVFRVVLPAASDRHPAPAGEGAPAPRARRGRVLVVDDDPLVASVMRRTLAAEHDVVVETSARAALARLTSGERFGAIVCDVMMPEMTGMELHAAAARVSREHGARLVFVTGGAFTPEAQRYLDRVPNPRLEKPFEADALRAAVRQVLGRPPEP